MFSNYAISFYVMNLVDIFINRTFWIENGYNFLSEPMGKYDYTVENLNIDVPWLLDIITEIDRSYDIYCHNCFMGSTGLNFLYAIIVSLTISLK